MLVKHPVRGLGLALALISSIGCTAGTTGEDFDLAGQSQQNPTGRCSPGDTQSCVCLGGGQGTQTCRSSGASFGPCTGCAGGDQPDAMPVQGTGSGCGTCSGCCAGTQCIPLNNESPSQCGLPGQTCAPCTGGTMCATGSGRCVSSSGGCGGCNGCCNATTGNMCWIDEPSACGSSCNKCMFGTVCESGVCSSEIDQNAAFKVLVTSAVVSQSAACPNNWDTFSNPDPYVAIGWQEGGQLIYGSNNDSAVQDVFSATWNGAGAVITVNGKTNGDPLLVPASVFTSGKMQITLLDQDDNFLIFSDDTIGQGFFPGTTNLGSGTFSTGPFGCAMNVTFQLVAP
jgi:hypothetical protein